MLAEPWLAQDQGKAKIWEQISSKWLPGVNIIMLMVANVPQVMPFQCLGWDGRCQWFASEA